MDDATRDFIIKENDKLSLKIDKLQETFGNINTRLGQGAEKFKANDTYHKVLLTLILLALCGLGGLGLAMKYM